jgi:two-component system response regulator RegX3
MGGSRLLVVEDDAAMVRAATAALQREGFEVTAVPTAEDALAALPDLDPAAVVLDVSLPGMSGLEACAAIKGRSSVPVIMLTGRAQEADRVLGLEVGADDYVVKPFSGRELAARIRAILRRRSRPPGALVVGPLRLDPGRREAWREGRTLSLSPREFDLLAFLMTRSPDLVTREELMAEVWDPHWHGSTKTLDVHISQLRRKIEDDPSAPRLMRSVRGRGYAVVAA